MLRLANATNYRPTALGTTHPSNYEGQAIHMFWYRTPESTSCFHTGKVGHPKPYFFAISTGTVCDAFV